MNKKWYLLYVKRSKEVKVTSLLSSKNIESFCPMNNGSNANNRKSRILEDILFPSYIFVKATNEEMGKINGIHNVINPVYWKNDPVTIPNEYMNAIKSFTDFYREIKVQKIDISDDRNSKVKRIVTDSTIELILPSLGYKLITVISEKEEHNTMIRVRKIEIESAQIFRS